VSKKALTSSITNCSFTQISLFSSSFSKFSFISEEILIILLISSSDSSLIISSLIAKVDL